MFRNRHKPLVFALALALVLQMALFPAYAVAEQTVIKPPVAAGNPPVAAPSVTLDEAIRIVKEKFEIPAEFTEFYSGYNNYNNRETWSLNWNSPQAPGGSFAAQVASDTGEIINVNRWENVNPAESGLHMPKITREEGRKIATDLVAKLLGAKFSDLRALPDGDDVVPLSYYGPIIYTYSWQRYVNDIPFVSNGVNVQINSDNGKVRSYNLNWTNAELPAAKGIIPLEKAQTVFENTPMLELQYFQSPIVRPLGAGEQQKLQLVYRLSGKFLNGAIDALTGEPIKVVPNQWLAGADMGGMGSTGMAYSKRAPLTPAEQKEVEDNSKLLTKEQAVEAVAKWVDIPENLVLRGLNLGRNMPGQNRVWSLDWNAQTPDKENNGPQYMYARVDAVTGELLGFNINYPFMSRDKQEGLDYDAAQKIAEEFLKKIQPDKFTQVKRTELPQDIFAEKFPQMQSFNYQRLVNGLAFPDNGLNVAVDMATKRIVSYNLNWSNLQFPDLNNIISQSKAAQVFLDYRHLTLSYVQIIENGQPGSLRLVYQPQIKNFAPDSNMVEAKTGKLLDWQGLPLGQGPKAYKFTDISDNPFAQEISLLGQAGVFGEFGTEFKPKEYVNLVSLIRAMLSAQNGVWYNTSLSDEDVIKNAKDLGWLKENMTANSAVSRELLAKIMIRFLNLDRIADIQGVYQVLYQDAASLTPSSLGYVALAKGLGILQVAQPNLEPAKLTTREEAAVALIKTLMARRY
ncbi:S-layer homology domain-containing protein [Paradesulfitobacterium aromaticivorans]